ncbi:hypothetical protein D3C72_1593330 [compost metagenome]
MPGPRHFGDAFRQGLAFLPGQQRPQLALPRQQFRADGIERRGAGLDATGGPGRLCLARGAKRHARLGSIGLRVLADDVADIRGVLVAPDHIAPGAAHPFAPNEVPVHLR